MNWLGDVIQNQISNDDSILDLGCGIMSATYGIKCKSILGVDIWPKYLNHIKNDYNVIKLSMEETDRFMDKSFDVVFCLDVLEHLEKNLALKILDECKRIARKKVIIYTPAIHKDNSEAEKNAWDMGECKYQKHISVITKEELKIRDYKVYDPAEDKSHFAIWSV